MNTVTWIQLIAQVGLPAAERLWRLWKSGDEITDETWAALKSDIGRPISDYEKGIVP